MSDAVDGDASAARRASTIVPPILEDLVELRPRVSVPDDLVELRPSVTLPVSPTIQQLIQSNNVMDGKQPSGQAEFSSGSSGKISYDSGISDTSEPPDFLYPRMYRSSLNVVLK